MVSAKQRDSCFQKVVFFNVIPLLIFLILPLTHVCHTIIIKKNKKTKLKHENPTLEMN